MITAANGKPVHDIADLTTIFEEAGVGKTVTLTVSNGAQSRSTDVTLADVSQKHDEGMIRSTVVP